VKGVADGWLDGFIGMTLFAGSLPATRAAVGGLSPWFVSGARAAIAGCLAAAALLILRQSWPRRADLASIAVVALGVVIGFPLLTGLALTRVSSAHALAFTALLPISTAIFSVLRGEKRPPPPFWLFSAAGAAIVVTYAVGDKVEASVVGDGLLIAAIAVCGIGYAEGSRLARRLGGWQTISWALVMCWPLSAAASLIWLPTAPAPPAAWIGLGYVSVFSMFVGFIFWYRGLARGGAASVGQLQLLQPLIGLALAAAFLGESVPPSLIAAALGAIGCVAGARWASIRPPDR
jgi:drug/metabolite transporter (DMT)-like permease